MDENKTDDRKVYQRMLRWKKAPFVRVGGITVLRRWPVGVGGMLTDGEKLHYVMTAAKENGWL